VFTGRGPGTDRRGQARIFAVALIVINSVYFFGRSHEHNLVNLGTSFLFIFFLGVDMAWPSKGGLLRWICRVLPWAVVAICAFAYSGRIVTKVELQKEAVVVRGPLPPMDVNREPVIDCDEVARAVGNDRRVYFFSKHDYWYYQRCRYVPSGYTQPMLLNVLTAPLAAELNQLLGMGYRIVVPRRGDWSAAFADIRPRLANLQLAETPGFQIYRLASGPAQ
jgi:hypothetical protein